MQKITDNIYKLERLKVSSVYLIKEEGMLTIIDTGMAGDLGAIKKEMALANAKIEKLNRIIITHAHMDNVGNLKKLSALSGAQVYVHEGDYGEIKSKVPDGKLHALKDKEQIDMLGKTEVVHVPGHTDGSIALYAKDKKILFGGDCLFNNKGLSLPPEIFNKDTALFKKSVVKLLDYDVDMLCTAHGPHIEGGCNEKIAMVIEKG